MIFLRPVKDRKYLTAWVILISLPVLLTGQTPVKPDDAVFRYPLNGETRPRFNSICAALAEHRVIRGQFVQTKTLKRLGRSLVSRGVFAVDAERGMIWDTKTPFPSVMAVGRDFLVQSSGGRSTRLDAAGNETFIRISETMSAVFIGDSKKLTGNFDVYFTESGGNWKLGLLPKDSSIKAFAGAIVMKGDSAVKEVMLYEQSGDTVLYELKGHSYPAALSAEEKAYFVP
jgi:hypothetical protein